MQQTVNKRLERYVWQARHVDDLPNRASLPPRPALPPSACGQFSRVLARKGGAQWPRN